MPLNTLLILDIKEGKPWWKREISEGVWEFVSKEENDRHWQKERELRDKIAARVYNRAFES